MAATGQEKDKDTRVGPQPAWEALPTELLVIIFDYVCPADHCRTRTCLLGSVCWSWRVAGCEDRPCQNNDDAIARDHPSCLWLGTLGSLARECIRRGSARCADRVVGMWAWRCAPETIIDNVRADLRGAVADGRVEVLRAVRRYTRGSPVWSRVAGASFNEEGSHVIEWLLDESILRDPDDVYRALSVASPDVFDRLAARPDFVIMCSDPSFYARAVLAGETRTVERLRQCRCPLGDPNVRVPRGNDKTLLECALRGGIAWPIIRWLRDSGARWTSHSFLAAVRWCDDPTILQNVLEDGCPWVSDACSRTLGYRPVWVIEWALCTGLPVDHCEVIEGAIEFDNASLLQWYNANGLLDDDLFSLVIAAAQDPLRPRIGRWFEVQFSNGP